MKYILFRPLCLFSLIMCMVSTKTLAYDISVANYDGVTIYYTFINNKSELEVTYSSYKRYSNEIVIPESVTYNGNTYNVTSIGVRAFYDCYITSVTIPKSIKSIGSNAFLSCSGLTSVKIDDLAAWCKISFDNNSSNPLYYAHHLYFNGEEVKDLVIPNGVSQISPYAFYGCTGLTSVTIPNNVTSIGGSSFYGCSNLRSVKIPESITAIGDYVFYNCSNLPSITLPKSVTKIGSYAFSGCSSINSIIIPNSVTTIDSNAFSNCNNLESMTIGAGVLSIGSSVFNGHTPAKVIWLTNTPPSGYSNAAGIVNYVANILYTSLSNKTVYDFLSSLFEVNGVKYVPVSPSDRTCDVIDCLYDEGAKSIHIGKTVTNKGITLTVNQVKPYAFYNNKFVNDVDLTFVGNVGNYAFSEINNNFTANINNSGYIGPNAFLGSRVSYLKIGSNVTYIGESAFSGIVSSFTANINNTEYIGTSAFKNSSGMTSLEIGSNVTNINQQAFYKCTGLKVATIKNKGSIGDEVFLGCSSMETATLGEEITSIGSYAFSGCSSLKAITLPDAVKSLGKYAFQNCSKMTLVKMGTGIKNIETYTFSGCSSLTNMQIGTNVASIYTYAFNSCSTLPTITIPKAVTDIKNYVFSGCTGLKTVIMEDRDTELNLGSNGSSPLFSSCPLDSVYIGGNISYPTSSSSGYSPFYRNTSLRAIMITDKETDISENEFYGCTNLKNVYIGDGVESIGNWAFSGCSSLDYFAFGSALKTIGKEAFSDCTAVTKIISKASTPPTCGTQALDDINKWTCSLIVPTGVTNAYKAASQWKEFFYINEGSEANTTYQLTYKVDGKEYKTYQLKVGETITPEPAPTKEGYTFSGWSTIPEKMPANDVTVTGSFTKIELKDGNLIEVQNADGVTFYYKIINNGTELEVIYRGESYNSYANEYSGKVVIPEVVFYQGKKFIVTSINYEAFRECTKMTAITIPNSIKNIGLCAFGGCESLKEVHILSLEAWCKITFHVPLGMGCLFGAPDRYLFVNGDVVTDMVIPSTVAAINDYCFYALTLNSLTIPGSVKTIGTEAFSNCFNLTSVTLNEGVNNIKDYAFANCDGLTSIIIPASVTNIGYCPFVSCDNLTSITCKNPTPPVVDEDIIDNYNITLYVPKGSLAAYKTAEVWKKFKNIVEIDSQAAETSNTLSIDNISASKGSKVVLPIQLINQKQITGLQFDLYLPQGVSVATNSKGKLLISTTERMDGNYSVTGSDMGNYVRVIGYSADTDAFSGSSGAILNVTLNIADGLADGLYSINIKDIVLSDVNNTEFHPADVSATMTVKSYTLGDVDNSGAININDVVCIINHILNKANGVFIREAADVDGSGAININDVVTLINRFILKKSSAPRKAPRLVAMTDDNYMSLATIDIKPGETKEVALLLNNQNEVKAVQGNLKLPAGLTFATKSNGRLDVKNDDSRSEDFTLSCALQDDGSMTFVHYSADGFAYDGNEGGIFTFKIKADENAAPGSYEVKLSEMVLSIEGVAYEETDRTCPLNITSTNGISEITIDDSSQVYTLDGLKVSGKPTKPGVYIRNGRKFVVK